MSKASAWVDLCRAASETHKERLSVLKGLQPQGWPLTSEKPYAFASVTEAGELHLSGGAVFPPATALALTQWIIDTFGETP